MEKVKLPRHVVEALEKAKESSAWGKDPEFIAWCIPDREWALDKGEPWLTLHEYGDKTGNFFKLIDALRYGYEIEEEPITVTITPEMQDELRKVYNDCPFNEKVGFRSALTALDLKIPGVNA